MITSNMVTKVIVDNNAPRSNSVSGYGPKIPTRYRLVCKDGKTRRVYMLQYGNAGTPYVMRNGIRCFFSTEVESMVEAAAK